MIEAGVCGTDREICVSNTAHPPGLDQLVIGHESLWEVVA
jgi:threonine dehydrogenase-like Zn-dependent dehydrogenase